MQIVNDNQEKIFQIVNVRPQILFCIGIFSKGLYDKSAQSDITKNILH